jgi:hypothetical protein
VEGELQGEREELGCYTIYTLHVYTILHY